MHTHACMHRHIHKHKQLYSYTLAHTLTYTLAHALTCTHINTHSHTNANTLTHTRVQDVFANWLTENKVIEIVFAKNVLLDIESSHSQIAKPAQIFE